MSKLVLLIFIDAFGWEIYKHYGFLESEFSHAKPLETVFGYSSAAVPSIMTGRYPQEHHHWSSFYYDPSQSPFRTLKKWRFLPKALMNRGRIRHWLSKWTARRNQYTGYFTLGNIPFEYLPYFDYLEKRDYFVPGGILNTDTILDWLHHHQRHYHCSNWRLSEAENIAALRQSLEQESLEFAFLYLPQLDGLMHQVGPQAPEVEAKLQWYESQVADLLQIARRRYQDVSVYLCSDHGMKTCTQAVNLIPLITATGLKFGRDYSAIYDSTMARFWFLKPTARQAILTALAEVKTGQWLSSEQLQAWGCHFSDGRFGEAIFLLEPGALIAPSFMNRGFVTAMHGYAPEDPDSEALLLSNRPCPNHVTSITHIRGVVEGELKAHVI